MRFELQEPQCLEEATSLLSKYGEDSRVIAGGQSLLLMIRAGVLRPELLVSLGGIDNLRGITTTPDAKLRIGGLTTHRQILASPLVKQRAPLLAESVARIGSTPVRNLGTIGGNVCHNEMGSDPPSALLALNAVVECCSARGKRSLPLSGFLTGYFETFWRRTKYSLPLSCRNSHRIAGGPISSTPIEPAILPSSESRFCYSYKMVLAGTRASR